MKLIQQRIVKYTDESGNDWFASQYMTGGIYKFRTGEWFRTEDEAKSTLISPCLLKPLKTVTKEYLDICGVYIPSA
jgi:hypothetical protein